MCHLRGKSLTEALIILRHFHSTAFRWAFVVGVKESRWSALSYTAKAGRHFMILFMYFLIPGTTVEMKFI